MLSLTLKTFYTIFPFLTDVQKYSLLAYRKKKNVLIISPTGSGKTLAAFMGPISSLLKYGNQLNGKIYIVYICTLKALVEDQLKNINLFLDKLNMQHGFNITAAAWTGDTSQHKRKQALKAHILLTTVESLSVILADETRISCITHIIVDEVHALAVNKRGSELSINIARLRYINPTLHVTGLSATVSPIKDVALFLFTNAQCSFKIIKGKAVKKLRISCTVPGRNSYLNPPAAYTDIFKRISNLINKTRGITLIFSNTKSSAERIHYRLSKIMPHKRIYTHHASLSSHCRKDIENLMKLNQLDIVISAASLEQGIDISTITQVIQVDSPKQIARTLQRVGRSGHSLHSDIIGHFFAVGRDDALEIAAIGQEALLQHVDVIRIPKNTLDMLSQAILNILCNGPHSLRHIYRIVKNSYVYRQLNFRDFYSIVAYLKGYVYIRNSSKWMSAQSKVVLIDGKLHINKFSKIEYLLNIGSIVTEEINAVILQSTGEILGYVEDAFLETACKGLLFTLGGKHLKINFIRGNNIYTHLYTGVDDPTIPVWVSDELPISIEVAQRIRLERQAILSCLYNHMPKEEVYKVIRARLPLNLYAIIELYDHIKLYYMWLRQHKSPQVDLTKTINVEVVALHHILADLTEDSLSIIFHAVYGRDITSLLCHAMAAVLLEDYKILVSYSYNDHGFIMHAHKKDIDAILALLSDIGWSFRDDFYRLLSKYVSRTSYFRKIFKRINYRGLALVRNTININTDRRKTMPSYILLNMYNKPAYALYKEAVREMLYDIFDYNGFIDTIQLIRNNFITFNVVKGDYPSTFSYSIIRGASPDSYGAKSIALGEFLQRINESIERQPYSKLYEWNSTIRFLEDCALIWQTLPNGTRKSALILSDLHIGMDYHLYKGGSKLEAGTLDYYIDRLQDILFSYNVKQIILLGDVKESIFKATGSELKELYQFIDHLLRIAEKVVVVKGNHDAYLYDTIIKQHACYHTSILDTESVWGNRHSLFFADAYFFEDILLHHGHRKWPDLAYKISITGHEHPKLLITMANGIRLDKGAILVTYNSTNKGDITNICLPAFNRLKAGDKVETILTRQKLTQGHAFLCIDDKWFKQTININQEQPKA